MAIFTKDQELSTSSICDSNCIFKGIVIKRTAKSVVLKTSMRGEKRVKIHNDGDGEYIFPFGQYSMAPIFRA